MKKFKKSIKIIFVMSLVSIFAVGCACINNKKSTDVSPTKIDVPVVTKAEQKPVELMASLKGSTFKNNRSELTPEGKKILDQNVETMKKNPKLKVRVAGHTSASGSAEANQKLSEKRAESVKSYMVQKGIASDRLTTIGYGSSRPAVHEPTPNNPKTPEATTNRRVELEIVEK